jgi:hypothetical protein
VNLSGKSVILIQVEGASGTVGSWWASVRFNADSGSVYYKNSIGFVNGSPIIGTGAGTQIVPAQIDAAGHALSFMMLVQGCNGTGPKVMSWTGVASVTATASVSQTGIGMYVGTSAITSITIASGSGNFDAGTLFVYAG